MVPQSPKRRKLEHGGRTSPDHGGSVSPGLDKFQQQVSPGRTEGLSKGSLTTVRGFEKSRRTKEIESNTAYLGDAHKSSMFKLQTDEMLAEIQKYSSVDLERVDKALRTLKAAIEGIEKRGDLTVHEAMKLMQKSHKINIPFPDPKPGKNAAYKLSYAPPSDINVVGSYALKTIIHDERVLAVDLLVTMPSSILQEKDFLNYRYFYKRAYYLACIAIGLQSSTGDVFNLKFGYFKDNTLQPMLVVTLSKDETKLSGPKFRINIVPAAPEGFFEEKKLAPIKNCIRPRAGFDNETSNLAPTPFYNASLLADCNFGRYLKLLHRTSKQVNGFRASCLLGQIWLRQRGLGGEISKGGFGSFEWAAIMALLLQGGGITGQSVLSPGYSSYQLFKGLIQFLASNDFVDKPVLFTASGTSFETAGSPLFFDGPRAQNLLFKMTPWSYATLHEEAKVSLEMLNDTTFDQFEATFFLKKNQPLQEFDLLMQLPTNKVSEDTYSPDHSNPLSEAATKLYNTLKEGLSDRVKLVQVKVPESPFWDLKAIPLYASSMLQVGVVFNPSAVGRVVDHGPAAENKSDATKFRKFWGEKAELRRFKDGSILESVVWSNSTGSTIVKEIVTYLLRRHFSAVVSESTTFVGDCFRDILPFTENDTKGFGDLMGVFRSFEQNIRDMDALPLQLKQLSPASAQLRYSSTMLPAAGTQQHQRCPAEVNIQFEGSGKWPDDIAAIQRTKFAFLLKIGSLLESSIPGLIARLGMENPERPLLNCAFLDVLYPTGSIFRLRIHNEREYTLLERHIKDKSASSHSREDAVLARSEYSRIFVQMPLHTQSVSTLCTRFPLLSPCIRLLKRWFASHMLSNHFREEFIELLVLRTFLQPYPWQVPSSSTTGFLRALQFMSRWNWRTTPLVVDFNGTMASRDVDAVQTRLEAWRRIDPGMHRTVLLAASSHDNTGTAFTEGYPSKVVATRMTALARSACVLVKRSGLEVDPMVLFNSTTDDYDFVIHLAPDYTGERRGSHDPKPMPFRNLELQAKLESPMVGYEPTILLLEEISALYATNVVFFHDPISNAAICGLWNPETFWRPFKVSTSHATRPVGKESAQSEAVEIDKAAILSEIARLGGSMIARIETRK